VVGARFDLIAALAPVSEREYLETARFPAGGMPTPLA